MTLNDLSVFDLDLCIWLRPRQIQGSIEGRYRHTASSTSRAMYIFGGINLAQKRFNDVNEYNFETQTWTRRVCFDLQPTTRTFHQSAILDNLLLVFGGFDGMKRNDLYRSQVEIWVSPDPNIIRSSSNSGSIPARDSGSPRN